MNLRCWWLLVLVTLFVFSTRSSAEENDGSAKAGGKTKVSITITLMFFLEGKKKIIVLIGIKFYIPRVHLDKRTNINNTPRDGSCTAKRIHVCYKNQTSCQPLKMPVSLLVL